MSARDLTARLREWEQMLLNLSLALSLSIFGLEQMPQARLLALAKQLHKQQQARANRRGR